MSLQDSASDRWRDVKAIADELEASYWVPLINTPFASLDDMAAKSSADVPALHHALVAFRTNLHAAKELLELPYFLIAPLVPLGGQLGRLGEDGDAMTPEQEALAIDVMAKALVTSKEHFSRRPELQRLMHQACLLTWAAFETYCKSVFIAAVNQKPSLYTVILKSQVLKERFGLQQGSWPGILEAHSYDLNGKLGTILGADKDFSSPQLLMDLFPCLFEVLPGVHSKFMAPFDSKEFWRLGQRRHLIAHRCGIVDEEYLRRTSDETQSLGAALKLRGRDVGDGLGIAARLAIGLYARARFCWYTQEQIDRVAGSA
ncbi:MAG: hypothetical protein H0X13_07830 [Ramlibacter sp.]|nr:hypothetical protein [Ramlibacter sp.]